MSGGAEDRDEVPGGGFRLWMLVPALGALAVLAVFLLGLNREGDGHDLPSALIGKAAPEFDLPSVYEGRPGLSSAEMTEPGVKLVNIWASWCVPCRAEHPKLEELAAMGLTVHGINYKDSPEGALNFLEELGDPFTRVGADASGRTGIEWGVYGVPETFVIDGQGRIVYKHIGPITGEQIQTKILPAVEKARSGG